MGRTRLNVGALLAFGLIFGTAASAMALGDSRAATRQVLLTVRGNGAPRIAVRGGAHVAFSSRATLHAGDRILIVARPSGTSSFQDVAVCRRSPCLGTWVDQGPRTVVFQGLLAHGTSATAVVAKSRRVTVVWNGPISGGGTVTPPPVTPPPAPVVQSGHYQGSTSQNEAISFDVTADGTSIVRLSTGQVNESCTPDGSLYGGNLSDWTAPITAAGMFAISRAGTGTVGSSPSTDQTDITGRFSGALAQGTLVVRTAFVIDTTGQYGGGAVTSYSCTSNLQTWQATKTN